MNNDIVALRRELHSKPEVSNQEYATAEIIKRYMEKYEPTEIRDGIGGAGVAVIYSFPNEGKTITIRCELDALPIQEVNQMKYRSTSSGVSHKCGHDGHMAIVASLGAWLQKGEIDSGKVILLFQPAEENGQGAERVISDMKFAEQETDYIFALHNLPKEPMHDIIVMNEGFSAEVQSLIVSLRGKESHAAEPENGINPTLAISEIAQACAQLNVTDPENEAFAVLTPVHVSVGQPSYGISPGNGEIHYTIRTWQSNHMELLKTRILKIVAEISQRHSLDHDITWLEYFPASINDPESNNLVRMAAKDQGFTISEREYPFKFGEDFGWYTERYKTAIFGLGAGLNTPALHNADYDFPDEIISTGADMFKSIIKHILTSKQLQI